MLQPPFRPAVAGRVAFWLGPIAGALVSVISLRRMNCPAKANRVFLLTLIAAILLAILLILTPDILSRLIGFGAEIAFWLVFPRIQDWEFEDWQNAHPDVLPSNGWRAIGWGLLGLFLFLLTTFLVAMILSMLVPSVSQNLAH
jgi:hypothetical protein